MAEESERAYRHRTELVASLRGIEAFSMLGKVAQKKEEGIRKFWTARIERGEDLVALQRQFDYDRGWIDAMKYLTELVPAGAARTLATLDRGEEPDEPEEDYWNYERTQPE